MSPKKRGGQDNSRHSALIDRGHGHNKWPLSYIEIDRFPNYLLPVLRTHSKEDSLQWRLGRPHLIDLGSTDYLSIYIQIYSQPETVGVPRISEAVGDPRRCERGRYQCQGRAP